MSDKATIRITTSGGTILVFETTDEEALHAAHSAPGRMVLRQLGPDSKIGKSRPARQ